MGIGPGTVDQEGMGYIFVSERVASLYQLSMHVVEELDAVLMRISHTAHQSSEINKLISIPAHRCLIGGIVATALLADATVLHFARPTKRPTRDACLILFLLFPFLFCLPLPFLHVPNVVHPSHSILNGLCTPTSRRLPSFLPRGHRHVHDRATASLSLCDTPRHSHRRGDPVHAPKPHCSGQRK